MSASEVVGRLSRWSKWKMETAVKLGYPSRSSFMRLIPADSERQIDPGIEMECQQTEQAFQELPEIPKLVLRAEYLSTCTTDIQKARVLGISKRAFIQYRNAAHEKMASFLNFNLTHRAQFCDNCANDIESLITDQSAYTW